MNIFKIYVNFNEGTKDYVSATLYKNDVEINRLSDISKPESVSDYTDNWKNGLINHYYDQVKSTLSKNDLLVTI